MSLNVGILGHVDCGKTTLTRILAELASTDAFDKHARNSGRQNTLDLGFSTLTIDGRRLALIDCPGHSSLIKAVLAASSVLDMALVVIDAANGIQPQTAEHLLLCSIFCPNHIMIVLNKIDLVPADEIPNIKKKLSKQLKTLEVNPNCLIVPLSLNNIDPEGKKLLLESIKQSLFEPERHNTGKFLMAVDHCFAVKGKGTVMTGTVVDGSISLNQQIELPLIKESRKVKGLESWKTKAEKIMLGERAAILVQNIDSDRFSRAMICEPGVLTEIQSCLCDVNAIAFYRTTVTSGTKFHITAGFETVVAQCHFLKPTENDEYENIPSLQSDCLVLMELEHPIYSRPDTFYIASKLEHQGKGCRFAFYGKLSNISNSTSTIKRFVRKEKRGQVQRIENNQSLICQSLFKKETKISIFEGMSVILSTGEIGRIESAFGKTGKTRISFSQPLADTTIATFETNKRIEVVLYLKKYQHDKNMLCKLIRSTPSVVSLRLISRSSFLYSRGEVDDDGLPKDYKLKKLRAGSRRLDTFVNRATGKSSSQVEKLVTGGRVRLNDEVCTKKSYNVQREDVIDVWSGPFPENKELAEVERTEIVDYEVTDKGYDFTVKSWKKFIVDNWRGG
ncbi:unnamed protein product [Auanema sp. JU1783]|nr:unnamed protein product [Auanema sp. JU1783]